MNINKLISNFQKILFINAIYVLEISVLIITCDSYSNQLKKNCFMTFIEAIEEFIILIPSQGPQFK